MSDNLVKKDLIDVINDLKNNNITSEQLTKACLEQIKKYDDQIGAMLWLNEEKSLEQAFSSDKRRSNNQSLSDIDGIPIAIKDMILTKDFISSAASKILENFIPPYDATVVDKLKNAGAVIIGKTNQDEFAMGSSSESSAYKTCCNPWNKEHSAGGSSGGSAACVSAHMAYAALGTDTGGSIRQPAAFCGLVGLKPTYGRVSRYGVIAFASSLDQVGPMAKNTKSCAKLLSYISGYDDKDSTSANIAVTDYAKAIKPDVKNKKIGIPKEYFDKGLPDYMKSAIDNSINILRQNQAEIVEISLPHTQYAIATYYIIATAEASSNLSRYDGVRFGPRIASDKSLVEMYSQTRGQLFGEEVKRRIILGTYVLSAGYYDAYYLQAQKVRRLFTNDFKNAFEKVDVILSPTTPTSALMLGSKSKDPLEIYLNDIYTISANLAGICAISLPCGKDPEGLPLGLQLMGRPFEEQTLFDTSLLLEEYLNFDANPKL